MEGAGSAPKQDGGASGHGAHLEGLGEMLKEVLDEPTFAGAAGASDKQIMALFYATCGVFLF